MSPPTTPSIFSSSLPTPPAIPASFSPSSSSARQHLVAVGTGVHHHLSRLRLPSTSDDQHFDISTLNRVLSFLLYHVLSHHHPPPLLLLRHDFFSRRPSAIIQLGSEKLPRQPSEDTMQITASITLTSPSIESHNDQVDNEAGDGLGDADHTIGEEDWFVVDETATC